MDNDEVGMSPVLAPALKKKDAPKETPAEPTPAKAGNVKSAAAGSSKGKRKAPAAGDDTKLISNKKAKAGDADKVVINYKHVFFTSSRLVLSSLYSN